MKQETINAGQVTIRHPSKQPLTLNTDQGLLEMTINVVSFYKQEKGVQTLVNSQLDGGSDIKLYLPLQSAPESILSDYQGLSVGLEIDGTDDYYFPMCQLDSKVNDDYVFIVQVPQSKDCDACYKNRNTMMTEANSV